MLLAVSLLYFTLYVKGPTVPTGELGVDSKERGWECSRREKRVSQSSISREVRQCFYHVGSF